MKRLLVILTLAYGLLSTHAASPAFSSFSTNDFTVVTNLSAPWEITARRTNVVNVYTNATIIYTNVMTINTNSVTITTNLYITTNTYVINNGDTNAAGLWVSTNGVLEPVAWPDKIQFDGYGGLYLGTGARDWEGGLGPTMALVGQSDLIGNDGGAAFVVESLDNISSPNPATHTQAVITTSTNLLSFVMRGGATEYVRLNPFIDPVTINAPYVLNTRNAITNANLLEVANNGTNQVTIGAQGQITTYGFTSGSDYSRLAISHTGTNGAVVFDSQSVGIAGDPRQFDFRFKSTNALSIIPASQSTELYAPFFHDATHRSYYDTVIGTNEVFTALSCKSGANEYTLEDHVRATGAYRLYVTPGGTCTDSAGSGDPNGAVIANVGSTYRRLDGGAGTSFYVKESGSGNTGWVGK